MNNQEKKDNKNKKYPNKNRLPNMKQPKSITFWIVALLLIIVFFQLFSMYDDGVKNISYTEFMEKVKSGEIKIVKFDGQDLSIEDISGQKYSTYIPFQDADLVKELSEKGVIVYSDKPSKLLGILISWLPFIILIGFWLFMMRGMRGAGNKVFSFGQSKAKLFTGGKTKVTFEDVAGVDEAKEELEEIIDYLKSPKKFQRLGGKIPLGVLLLGQPGTGKTLLAKAVAGEAKVPFYSISGSNFVEMFVGVGASRVRNLFEEAKKNAPCITFIDEIDAVGRSRGTGLGGGHDEREQTLNQLLVEMDGFSENDAVIIIAATNRPDVLDPALLRPGRFDRRVIVDMPDIKGRREILRVHTKDLPLADDVNLNIIARGTPGFSGADIANLANEAALIAAKQEKKAIEMEDFDKAKDKVTLGKERKSKVISEEEKRNTAFHEIGHVLCSIFQEKTQPIHKVTIIPRGLSGGATHYLETDKSRYTKSYLEQTLVGILGGRAAEEIVFEDISTGAANDLDKATDIAKKMVCRWGMSKKIGPITIGEDDSQVFLGKEISQHENISEDTAKLIDNEKQEIVTKAYKKAIEILKNKREILNKLAEKLIVKETLLADDIFSIILDNTSGEDKDLIKKKYKKAEELNITQSPVDQDITTEKTNKEN